jgi:hypothetical protein
MKMDALRAMKVGKTYAVSLCGQMHCRVRRVLEKQVYVFKEKSPAESQSWRLRD